MSSLSLFLPLRVYYYILYRVRQRKNRERKENSLSALFFSLPSFLSRNMAPPSAAVLKKAREAAAKLKKEKKMKDEEDLEGDMCGPMMGPPPTRVSEKEEEEEFDLDEAEAGPTMPPPRETTTEKKKGRWGDDDESSDEEKEEEEEPTTTTMANDNNTKNNKQKESYLEKMMNEQAEFANFTAQQMQEDGEGGEDGSVREDDAKRKRTKREAVDVAKLLTPPSDDSDEDDDNDKNMHGRKHAEIGRRQQPRIDATPEMEDLEDGHKTMDTPPMGGEVEYDDRKEAGPTLPPASVREQIVNANRGMVEERRALLDGAVANNKNINTNEFSESEEDEEDGRKMEYVPLLPKPHDHKKACRSVECFQKLGHIDEGTYGVVFKARDKETGEIAALKKVKMDKEKEGFPVTALREINTLLQLQHKNIVYVSEVVVGRSIDQVFMVMEYCGRDLNRMMDDMNRGFTLPECKCLAWQLLSGVSYLHENWVLHRDLKTTNVLFNDLGELKICDFGLAREYGSPLNNYTPLVCTLWYRPPELLLGEKKYSYAVDNWSLGCIIAELLQGKPLFPGRTEIDQIDKHFRMLGTPNEQIWPKFKSLPHATKVNFAVHPHNSLRQRFPKYREREDEIEIGPGISDAGFDLLNGLLVFDPERRLSSTEALKSSWFAEAPRKNSSREWQELLRRFK